MLRPALLLALLLPLAACDGSSVEAQRLFADKAILLPPSGITETTANGAILSRDADDWRIGPAYVGIVQLLGVPSPNPVRLGDAVSFVVDTQGVAGGLRLYVRYRDPLAGTVDLRVIRDPGAERPDATVSGFYPFSVSARQIALDGPGLYRVVLLDGRQGVVSYGDIEVQS